MNVDQLAAAVRLMTAAHRATDTALCLFACELLSEIVGVMPAGDARLR